MRRSTLGIWAALYAIDPWDDNRADLRAAQIASATVNAQGCKKEDGGHFTPRDFLPYVDAQVDQDALAMEREADISARVVTALMNIDGHRAVRD